VTISATVTKSSLWTLAVDASLWYFVQPVFKSSPKQLKTLSFFALGPFPQKTFSSPLAIIELLSCTIDVQALVVYSPMISMNVLCNLSKHKGDHIRTMCDNWDIISNLLVWHVQGKRITLEQSKQNEQEIINCKKLFSYCFNGLTLNPTSQTQGNGIHLWNK
jgi:hypothetical protein